MISPSFENFFVYNALEFDIISHVLTLGYAVMLAALFYFVMTIRTVAPRFRTSSVLSVVVMVSAALILFNQQQSWENGFVFVDEAAEVAALGGDGAEEAGVVIDVDALNNIDSPEDALGTYVPVRAFEGASAENPFTNGFRYLNWLIDVPMLLFQILFVVEITRDRRASIRNWFFFSGTGMIVTGYIGQFYEYTNGAGPEGPFWIWGAISTAFFFHVLFLMYQVINDARSNLSEQPSKVMGQIGILFFISWMLYPGAYLMPALLDNVSGVVGRQLTFTVADVSSKVIYGIMLTYVAQLRSDEEGYTQPDSDLLEGPKPAAGD